MFNFSKFKKFCGTCQKWKLSKINWYAYNMGVLWQINGLWKRFNSCFQLLAPSCYSKYQNLIFSFQEPFTNRIIYPYNGYIYQLYLFIQFLTLGFLVTFVTCVSEIPILIDVKKKVGVIGKFRFLFTLKNQIIFISLISTILPCILSAVSFFVDDYVVENSGNILAFLAISVQYVQIFTL